MFAKVVGNDLAPMKKDYVFMKFLESACPNGARDVEFVMVGAGEVGWFLEWSGFVALVANASPLVQRRTDVIVDSVAAGEHRLTQRALVRHYASVDEVALIVVGKLGGDSVLLELGVGVRDVLARVAVAQVNATNEPLIRRLIRGSSFPGEGTVEGPQHATTERAAVNLP